ncbi:MAG: Gfo/Idh/MocA family oxidoreductase [Gemmatimonadota bacterium]|jgi:predicted dehydrogenase|nr:Gfo/Idh/MocA family oxidoreductase [Gemmatimonadota bacterium]
MTAPNTARVAILGTGSIAQVTHLPILKRLPGVEIAGLSDVDRSRARTLADRFGVPRVYGTPEEIWKDPAVDGVFICTPSNAHEQQAIEALEAGKYVFCERPLALTSEGAARVVAAAGDSGRLMIGMNQRFRPDHEALRASIARGDLGEIRYLRAGWLNRRLARSARDWRLRKTGAGGGALMDLGVQMLDLALWLLGFPEPARVVAHLHAMDNGDVEDSALVMLELTDGRVIDLEATWALIADREHEYLRVLGSRGSGVFPPLRIFQEGEQGVRNLAPAIADSGENQFTATYRRELELFCEAVRAGTRMDTPVDQITLMTIVEGAYRSAETRSEVRFG